MRVAVTAVAAAVVGTGIVLLSTVPAAPAADARSAVQPVVAVSAQCPPCNQGPMGPIAWQQAIARPDGADPLARAAALSLAMGEPRVVEHALTAEDPALRELAALLLNVASGRVAGCTELTQGGHVAAVLDTLDQLVAKVRDGEPIPAEALAGAAGAAAVINRGEGLPDDCSG